MVEEIEKGKKYCHLANGVKIDRKLEYANIFIAVCGNLRTKNSHEMLRFSPSSTKNRVQGSLNFCGNLEIYTALNFK